MKAICVTSERKLDVRNIPAPETPPPGHLLVDITAATVTHGDKFFLTRPLPGGSSLSAGGHDVYGANGAGRVAAVGEGVPPGYAGRQVAIYKSLARSRDTIGLWCERAQVPAATCLILPDNTRALDYCGSLANVLTVNAFLAEIAGEGHAGFVVTAGTSATGRAAVSLARRRKMSAIFLVRSAQARAELVGQGVEHVIDTAEEGFEAELGALATELGATAVFDGVGGAPLSRIMPTLPMNTVIYTYGFLGGAAPITLPTTLLMGKNLVLRRFANLDSPTVKDPPRLAAALKEIEGWIDDPLFRTRIGQEFSLDEIDQAMAYEAVPGARAVLVP